MVLITEMVAAAVLVLGLLSAALVVEGVLGQVLHQVVMVVGLGTLL